MIENKIFRKIQGVYPLNDTRIGVKNMPPADYIYSGGVRYSGATTRKLSSTGSLIWSVDHGATVYGIDVNSSGYVVTGGDVSGTYSTRVYNDSGTFLWGANHGARVHSVKIDEGGNVYTVGARTSSLTTRCYSSTGTLLWSKDHGNIVYGIDVDSDGNVYTNGGRAGDQFGSIIYATSSSSTDYANTRKYAGDGTLIWSSFEGTNIGDFGNRIKVDKDNNVYIAHYNGAYVGSYGNIMKRDASGTQVWDSYYEPYLFPVEMVSLCLESKLWQKYMPTNVYVATINMAGVSTTANKFRNSDGVECNTYENVKDYFNGGPTEIGNISSMAVDAAGYIYICGNDVYGQGQIMKLDREGNIEWNYQVGSGAGYLERAIAIR